MDVVFASARFLGGEIQRFMRCASQILLPRCQTSRRDRQDRSCCAHLGHGKARTVPVHTTAFGVYLPLPGLSQASRALHDQQGRQDSAWCSHECGPGSAISPGTLSYAPVRGRALFVPACRLERSVRDGQQAVQLDTSRAVCAPTMTLGCWRPYVESQLPSSRDVSQDSAFRRPHPFALVRAGLCT